MAFCTTLRRRPSCAPVVPSLTSSVGLGLKERELETHDISIPLDTNSKFNNAALYSSSTRQLRCLLLSISSTTPSKLPSTIARIQHFAALTGGQDLAIIFVLSPPKTTSFISAKELTTATNTFDNTSGIVAYSRLQAELMTHREIPSLPVLPITVLEKLPEMLRKHAAALVRPKVVVKGGGVRSGFDLLRQCTTEPPMDETTAHMITDTFKGLREVAMACTLAYRSGLADSRWSESGFATSRSQMPSSDGVEPLQTGDEENLLGKLRELMDMDEKTTLAMIDFWAEEWTLD